jgi:hypothetical protein
LPAKRKAIDRTGDGDELPLSLDLGNKLSRPEPIPALLEIVSAVIVSNLIIH